MATCTPQALPRESTCFHCVPPDAQEVIQIYLLNTLTGNLTARQLSTGAAPFRPIYGKLALAAKVYLLTVINGLTTSPAALMAQAKCWECIPPSARLDVETYLWAVAAGGSLTPATLTAQIGPYKSLYPIRDQVELYLLNLLAGSLSISAIMAGAKCYTCLDAKRLEEILLYLLCAAGSRGVLCADIPALLIPVVTGVYNGSGDLIALNILFPKVCCTASGYGIYGVNTGTNLQAGILPASASGKFNYQVLNVDVTGIFDSGGLYVRQGCSDGTLSGPSNTVANSNLDPVVLDWAARVVINGGAAPSSNSKAAASTFVTTLRSAGLFSKMKAVNMVAPDNLIAAETPLIVGTGLDPWPDVGSSNVVAADLTTYGIRFDGTKALNTGIKGSTAFGLASSGLTIVAGVINPNNGLRYDMGYLNAADQSYMYVAAAQTGAGNTGHAGGSSFSSGQITDTGAANTYAGYVSFNRTSATAANLYWANNDVAHASIGSVANNQTQGLKAVDIYFGAVADSLGGAIPYYSKNTLSFAAIHEGLTAAESLAFFNAINTLRTSFGGGYGDIGDSYVGSWVQRISDAGGAAPGTTSKAAVHALATSLYTGGVLTSIVSAVGLTSDSLIAAVTPVIYTGVGSASWTQHNFIAGDLTADGLLGAATKYLETGIIPGSAGVNPIAVGSAGLIAYNHTNNATGVQHELGVYGGSFNSFFGLLCDYNVGNTEGAAWRFDGNDNISTVTPASITGFYSFQRTTTSRADIYFARSNVAHASIANAVGALVGVIEATQPVYAFGANNNGGGVTGVSLKRISFLALTTGLSAAQDLVVYNAVQAFRTSLGGGFV